MADRDVDWQFNYRVPDVFVALASGGAVDRGTHWIGAPDLLAEILSPDEEPYAKLDFYSAIGVKELLILHRDPWKLERFEFRNASLMQVEACDAKGGSVTCATRPVTFRIDNRLRAKTVNHTWTI